MKTLLETLAKVKHREISLGYRTLTLFDASEIEARHQNRARAHATLKLHPGEWPSSWVIIGHEDLTGDPIFVDVSAKAPPVMTAMHDVHPWEPQVLARSLPGFLQALEEVRRLAPNRGNPEDLEMNPIPPKEAAAALKRIRRHTDAAYLEFWESWLEMD